MFAGDIKAKETQREKDRHDRVFQRTRRAAHDRPCPSDHLNDTEQPFPSWDYQSARTVSRLVTAEPCLPGLVRASTCLSALFDWLNSASTTLYGKNLQRCFCPRQHQPLRSCLLLSESLASRFFPAYSVSGGQCVVCNMRSECQQWHVIH